MIGNMGDGKAGLLFRQRSRTPDGDLIEMVVWQVPTPVRGSAHAYKYRLAFIQKGCRVVGFDNEAGKGDHQHVDGEQRPYRFVDVETLIGDFVAAVERRRQ
jgi:hypothetical protein